MPRRFRQYVHRCKQLCDIHRRRQLNLARRAHFVRRFVPEETDFVKNLRFIGSQQAGMDERVNSFLEVATFHLFLSADAFDKCSNSDAGEKSHPPGKRAPADASVRPAVWATRDTIWT